MRRFTPPRFLAALAALALLALAPALARAADPAWNRLLDRLAADGLPRAELVPLFEAPDMAFTPSIMAHKVDRMVRKQFEPGPPPGRKALMQSAYAGYLKPWTLAWARDYSRTHAEAFARAEAAYGVPREVILALLLVETKLGSFLGKDHAFQVLASMAASDGLEPIRPYLKTVGNSAERAAYADASAKDRSQWAYQELKALILYSRALGQSPATVPGSIYGAIGVCQFMPTNALRFGVDGNSDGRTDLFEPADAIPSIANYLVGHGWKQGLSWDQQRTVIYAYNHSDLYSLAVMTIADRLRQPAGAPVAARPENARPTP